MNKNLSKRIFTSIILSAVLLICLFFHKYSWLFLLIIASVICFFEFNNLSKKICKRNKTSIYFVNLISFFYLIFFTYTGYEIAKVGWQSELTMLIILFVCIFSDIGGYVIGKLIGGKKLTKISPNKTISGTIGSFVFSLIPVIFMVIIKNSTPNIPYYILYDISFLIFITWTISLICQSGDLFISYFKRKAKVKDTGTILPGHGGLLDRIDGIIFAIPSVFIIDYFFNL
jgi:phosphatidate cytidylyltransferase